MEMVFKWVGAGIILSGLVAWVLTQSPFTLGVISWVLSGFSFGSTAAVEQQVTWYASNLEIVVPLGIFVAMLFPPHPVRLAYLGGAMAVLGIIMWFMGF